MGSVSHVDLLRVLGKGQAETQEGRTFEGAAFSKTLLKLADQRCRRTRRNPSSLERRRRQARRLVRFSFMAEGHTASWQRMSRVSEIIRPPKLKSKTGSCARGR